METIGPDRLLKYKNYLPEVNFNINNWSIIKYNSFEIYRYQRQAGLYLNVYDTNLKKWVRFNDKNLIDKKLYKLDWYAEKKKEILYVIGEVHFEIVKGFYKEGGYNNITEEDLNALVYLDKWCWVTYLHTELEELNFKNNVL